MSSGSIIEYSVTGTVSPDASGTYVNSATITDPAGTADPDLPVAAISAASEAGSVVTITTAAAHNFAVGERVKIAGVTVSGYNGTFTITGVTANTFTYSDTANTGLMASGGGTAAVGVNNNVSTFTAAVAASGNTVLGANIFYNNSFFDTPQNNGPIVGAHPQYANNSSAPDTAVALDKVPLQQGQMANFSNYTSYSKGINGISLSFNALTSTELMDLIGNGSPTPGNYAISSPSTYFTVNTGNNNTPSGWATATTPTATLIVPSVAGAPDLVQLTWPNYDPNNPTAPGVAVGQAWIQVQVNAGTNLGLTMPDAFYFGNAPADTGNSATDSFVTATDEILVRNNYRLNRVTAEATIYDPYDFNRDDIVGGTDSLMLNPYDPTWPGDELFARNHATNFSTSLKLIQPTASPTVFSIGSSFTVTGASNTSTPNATSITSGVGQSSLTVANTQLPPVITVGNHTLLANTPNQKIQIFVSSASTLVQGTDVEVQIADGGPAAGGTVLGPKITNVDVLTGTIFATSNGGQTGSGSIVPQVYEATTVAGTSVPASGLLATITIDTTGFNGGTFSLSLGNTLNGSTDFTVIPAIVTDGSITITPPPVVVIPPVIPTPKPTPTPKPVVKSSISGNVYNDKNGNGKQDKGEAPIANWIIDIYDIVNGKAKLVEAVTTDKNGNYTLGKLAANTYYVYAVSKKGYKPTGKSLTGYQVKLGAGKNVTGYSFGERPIA
jgi:hypothetical protein